MTISQSLSYWHCGVSGPNDALEEHQMIALSESMEDYTWKVP
jgi:hypothetical protein